MSLSSFTVWLVVLCGMSPLSAYAQATLDVPAYRQDTEHNPFIFQQILQIKGDVPMESSSLRESLPITPRSHIRVTYSSKTVVPLRILFTNDPAADHQLVALLPPGTNAEARLDLTQSPAWRRMMDPLTIEIFSRADAPVEILGIEVENHLSIFHVALAYMKQPFMPEYFSSFSLGTIYGYKIAGYPLTMIVGILVILFISVLAIRKKQLLYAAILVWVPVLLLYETHFLFDIGRATVIDQAQWHTQGQYNDMRYLYKAADDIKAMKRNDDTFIAVCTGLITPMKYVLFPLQTGAGKDSWARADIGVTQGVWSTEQTTFTCEGLTRTGKVEKLYPDGEAIILFQKA